MQMALKFLILSCVWLFVPSSSEGKVEMILKTRSAFLSKYEQYQNVVIMRFEIPDQTTFAAFKFVADETDMSIYGKLLSIYYIQESKNIILSLNLSLSNMKRRCFFTLIAYNV